MENNTHLIIIYCIFLISLNLFFYINKHNLKHNTKYISHIRATGQKHVVDIAITYTVNFGRGYN